MPFSKLGCTESILVGEEGVQNPMTKKEESVETEDKVDELVKKWIEQNPAEFTVDGKSGSQRLRYRPRILERCKQYKNAPDKYLETMLKAFPENIKWYFNILQAVIMAVLVSSLAAVFILTINNFLTWLQKASSMTIPSISTFNDFLGLLYASFPDWIIWVFPASILGFVVFLAFKTNKVTESSWLSYLIQHKLRIVHNLTELKIEMYYVSKIITIREAEKKRKQ